MEWYLPLIWAAVIGIAVVMYVLLDGFDLGIGILFPFTQNESERDQMTRSIAPYWDGNELSNFATFRAARPGGTLPSRRARRLQPLHRASSSAV
jgi:hypothetical protein